jgi:signal transduction histidine kinase
LATAGITSLTYEHEASKQVQRVEAVEQRLASALSDPTDLTVAAQGAISDLRAWRQRATEIRKLFSSLISEEDRTTSRRFSAQKMAAEVAAQLVALSRGITIDTSAVPRTLLLPEANLPAWSAIFQNLYVNAINAVQHTSKPVVRVRGGHSGNGAWLRVEDNGVGVNLDLAEEYWRPFQRGESAHVDQDHILGGTGLGLTIVRLVARELGVKAGFAEPPAEFSTSVELSWKE